MSETSKYKELEPEKKKQKIETSDDDPSEEDEKKKKKVDRTKAGDAMFELSDKRKCFVRKWRNGILVDVREVSICMCCVMLCIQNTVQYNW